MLIPPLLDCFPDSSNYQDQANQTIRSPHQIQLPPFAPFGAYSLSCFGAMLSAISLSRSADKYTSAIFLLSLDSREYTALKSISSRLSAGVHVPFIYINSFPKKENVQGSVGFSPRIFSAGSGRCWETVRLSNQADLPSSAPGDHFRRTVRRPFRLLFKNIGFAFRYFFPR